MLVGENSAVITEHIDGLVGQLITIVPDGVEAGEFTAGDTAAVARAVFDATNRFHDPAYMQQWSAPAIDAAFDAVCDLVLAGLTAPTGGARGTAQS